MFKIYIASDHAGYNLKEYIYSYLKGHRIVSEVINLGTYSGDISVNYPDYAKKVALNIIKEINIGNLNVRGILICGTGLGMCITANKFKGIYAASVLDPYSASMASLHNNANIICFGGRVVGVELAKYIVDSFLKTTYEGGRHNKRLDIIKHIEKENFK